jgi:hypothetical protein
MTAKRTNGACKNQTGGGHSAARYAGWYGYAERSGQYVHVRGEGWVRWSELERQVADGHRDFLQRRALAGHYVPTFDSRQTAEAAERAAKLKQSSR